MDPYVYPNTHVLINKFDERNASKLLKLERRLSMLATLELRIKTFKIFNFSTLQYIHRKMFGDIYSWAGEIRKVDISKGNSLFCPAGNIEVYAKDIFAGLAKNGYLKGLEKDKFCNEAADLLGDLNALHPLREGNGRATREFLYHLSLNAGYYLNFALVDKERYIKASIESMHYSNDEFKNILCEIIAERED